MQLATNKQLGEAQHRDARPVTVSLSGLSTVQMEDRESRMGFESQGKLHEPVVAGIG